MLRREHGQVLPLLAAGLLVFLLGVTAIVADVGHAYLVKRKLQATADAAALAAADALPNSSAAIDTAISYGPAGKNPLGGVPVTQTVQTYCLRSISYCYGNTPGGPPLDGRANGLIVKEHATVPTRFAKLFGVDTISVNARSTACGMCGSLPLDIAVVVDRTGSMSDNMNDLRTGLKTFLAALDPRLDYVSLLVLPPVAGDICSSVPSWSSYPLAAGNPYPLGSDDSYVAVHLSQDYLNNDGSLNSGSALVRAINCMRPGGTTSYTQALIAAGGDILDHGSGRRNVQKVVVFESDGAANTAPDSNYDADVYTNFHGERVYRALSSREDYVLRPCGSAIDYAGRLKQSDVTVFTVAYGVDPGEDCFQAPHTTGPRPSLGAVGYQDAHEGISADYALAQIASPGGAVSQQNAGDMRASFTTVANKILGASLVPDSEADQ